MTFKTVRLGDIVRFNPRETIKKGELAKKIDMSVLQPFTRDVPSFEILEYKGGTKFRNGDTIMARITPCLENGKTSKVNVLEENEIGFGSTEYIVFRAIDGITDEDYVYYLVCSPIVREPAIKSMVGSSGRQRVQTDVLQNLEIPLPILETQRQIGSFLKSIDDRIAINTTINENLEQQAQAIFKNLFPNCMVNGISMNKVIDVRDGTHDSPKSQKSGHYLITSKHLQPYSVNKKEANLISDADYNQINERSKVAYGDILISMIGTVGLISFVTDNSVDFAIKNVGLFRTSQSEMLRFYILNYLKSVEVTNHIEQHLAGSTQKYISLTELRNLPVYIPTELELDSFNSLITPIYNKIIMICKENQRLSALRDALLPKLMNGEIDVSKVKI